jgi:hypothetical protein
MELDWKMCWPLPMSRIGSRVISTGMILLRGDRVSVVGNSLYASARYVRR